MELFVIPKGSKFIVQDNKGRIIYTIKKKSFGGKMLLYDASNYELYTLISDFHDKHPSFQILLNDKTYIWLNCVSRFLDPSISAQGETGEFLIKSTDRLNFHIIKNSVDVGVIQTQQMPSGDAQYAITIDDAEFDDSVPLFAICIDLSFAKFKK